MKHFTRIRFIAAVVVAFQLMVTGSALGQKNSSKSKIDGRPIATAGGQTLTDGHVRVGVQFINFLAGSQIKPAEETELKNDIMRSFTADPRGEIEQIREINSSMQGAYRLTDPLKIAEVRNRLLGELHQASLSLPLSEMPAAIKILRRYIKVLAFDQSSRMALTDKDLDATIAYFDFQRKLAGHGAIPAVQKTQFRKTVTNGYSQLPLDQKALFAAMTIIWDVTRANWNQLSPVQQQQIISQNRQRYVVPQASAGTGRVSASDSRAKDRLLNEIVMNGNIARTNMIGSMGNSNYWEVSRSRSSTSPLNW
ncbi:MAG: hypothetical protein IPM59_15055 [Chloracidobacterium sp.]|nr:hypothetical protein [Chloracidobacterium sp.]